MKPSFAYLQARLQARHGRRLDEAEWQRLARVPSYDLFLKQARETSLAPLLQTIGDGEASVQSLEQRLKARFVQKILEIITAVPESWRPAARWTVGLLDLPVLQHAQAGGEPLLEAGSMVEILEQQDWNTDQPLWALWLDRWRKLWPKEGQRTLKPLETLVRLLQQHRVEFSALEGHEAAVAARMALEARLVGLFRSHALQPVAVFVHLVLTFLDYERLRGELVRHLLFHYGETLR